MGWKWTIRALIVLLRQPPTRRRGPLVDRLRPRRHPWSNRELGLPAASKPAMLRRALQERPPSIAYRLTRHRVLPPPKGLPSTGIRLLSLSALGHPPSPPARHPRAPRRYIRGRTPSPTRPHGQPLIHLRNSPRKVRAIRCRRSASWSRITSAWAERRRLQPTLESTPMETRHIQRRSCALSNSPLGLKLPQPAPRRLHHISLHHPRRRHALARLRFSTRAIPPSPTILDPRQMASLYRLRRRLLSTRQHPRPRRHCLRAG